MYMLDYNSDDLTIGRRTRLAERRLATRERMHCRPGPGAKQPDDAAAAAATEGEWQLAISMTVQMESMEPFPFDELENAFPEAGKTYLVKHVGRPISFLRLNGAEHPRGNTVTLWTRNGGRPEQEATPVESGWEVSATRGADTRVNFVSWALRVRWYDEDAPFLAQDLEALDDTVEILPMEVHWNFEKELFEGLAWPVGDGPGGSNGRRVKLYEVNSRLFATLIEEDKDTFNAPNGGPRRPKGVHYRKY